MGADEASLKSIAGREALTPPSVDGSPPVPEEFRSHLPTAVSYALGAYLVLIGTFSLLTNVLSLMTHFRCKKKDARRCDLLTVNISISDLCLVLLTFPFTISSLFAERWLFYKGGCVAYSFASFLFGLQNMMAIMLYAVVRYIAVCHPFTGSRLLAQGRILTAMTVLFCYCVLWSSLPLGAWGSYGPEPYGTACSINWTEEDNGSFVATIFVFVLLLPVVINVYCYVQVSLYARRSARALVAASCTVVRGAKTCRNTSRNKYLTMRGFLLTLSFIVCWTPYAVVSFWAAFGDPRDIPLVATAIPATMCKTVVLLNPILYLITNRRFVRAVRSHLSTRKSLSWRTRARHCTS